MRIGGASILLRTHTSTRRSLSMPHIDLPEGVPGIRSAMQFRPETAVHLNALAEQLLRADNTLSRGDRELIAAYVSSRNKTVFCEHSHSAFAALQLDGGVDLVEDVKRDPDTAPIDPKLRALVHIAGKVAVDGKSVKSSDIEAARGEGATDLEIHDTVLIAAAFCMYNRYVDGLDTWQPSDPEMYRERARLLVEHGYGAAVPASA
jgi:uncharacterized peroxidase-related enzyme